MIYRNQTNITGRTIALESNRRIEYVPGVDICIFDLDDMACRIWLAVRKTMDGEG